MNRRKIGVDTLTWKWNLYILKNLQVKTKNPASVSNAGRVEN
jgi:hypothetical protein